MTTTLAHHEISGWMRETLAVVVGDIEPILGKVPAGKALKVSLTSIFHGWLLGGGSAAVSSN